MVSASTVPRRRVLLALPVALLALLCVGLPAAVLALRPSAPRTHEESVRGALERRGVRYQAISFVQSYEESVEFDFYRAQVLVQTGGGRTVSGWIGCEDRDSVCFLELRGLGITGERLPELVDDPLERWRAWALAALARAGLHL